MTEDDLKRIEGCEIQVKAIRAEIGELGGEVRQLREERDKLQAFKDWVHAYLDGKGVPHHPPGVHGAEGCRIGDRMDWVFARIAELETKA